MLFSLYFYKTRLYYSWFCFYNTLWLAYWSQVKNRRAYNISPILTYVRAEQHISKYWCKMQNVTSFRGFGTLRKIPFRGFFFKFCQNVPTNDIYYINHFLNCKISILAVFCHFWPNKILTSNAKLWVFRTLRKKRSEYFF